MATTAPSVRLPFGLGLPDSVSVLAERDFRVVWTGQAVSMVGTWMQVVAQGLLVLQLWDSEFALGALNFANAVPTLAVMLFGGVLADTGDKRRILIVSQGAMCALAAIIGTLVLVDRIEFWMLIVATILLGIVIGYDMPAYQALMPELVPPEKISQVVAINSSTFHGSRMVGPAVAGAVIGAFGLATAYYLNALSFVAVLLSLLIIRYRPKPAPAAQGQSAIEGLKAGFRHARGRPNLQVMLGLTALNTTFLFPTMAVLSPAYVKYVLDGGPGVLGGLFAMSGLGSLVGALVLIWWPVQARAGRIWVAVLVAPIALAAMALTRDVAVALIAAGVLSVAFSSQLGLYQAMIQESTPPAYRGRVMSLHGIMFNGTMPFATLATSGLAVAFGLPAVMVGSAALYLLTAAAMLRFGSGGIGNVVRASAAEYTVVAAEPR